MTYSSERCPDNETACPIGQGDGFECIDTTTALDSCGLSQSINLGFLTKLYSHRWRLPDPRRHQLHGSPRCAQHGMCHFPVRDRFVRVIHSLQGSVSERWLSLQVPATRAGAWPPPVAASSPPSKQNRSCAEDIVSFGERLYFRLHIHSSYSPICPLCPHRSAFFLPPPRSFSTRSDGYCTCSGSNILEYAIVVLLGSMSHMSELLPSRLPPG